MTQAMQIVSDLLTAAAAFTGAGAGLWNAYRSKGLMARTLGDRAQRACQRAGPAPMTAPKYPDVSAQLTGQDGDALTNIGAIARALRMRVAFVALVLALAAPAASQPGLAEFDLEALEVARVEIGTTGRARIDFPPQFGLSDRQVILDATGPTSAGYYLAGTLEGLPDWPVKVVVHGQLVAATVYWTVWRSGDGSSTADAPPAGSSNGVRAVGNDVVMVPRLSRASEPLRLTAEDAAAPMEDGSWIDVLVFYTPEAKQEDAGGNAAIMELLVDLMIVHTNAVYAESGVAHRLRLAAQPIEAEPLRESGFRSSGEMIQMLSEWERGRELRDRYAADLVTLMFRGKGAG